MCTLSLSLSLSLPSLHPFLCHPSSLPPAPLSPFSLSLKSKVADVGSFFKSGADRHLSLFQIALSLTSLSLSLRHLSDDIGAALAMVEDDDAKTVDIGFEGEMVITLSFPSLYLPLSLSRRRRSPMVASTFLAPLAAMLTSTSSASLMAASFIVTDIFIGLDRVVLSHPLIYPSLSLPLSISTFEGAATSATFTAFYDQFQLHFAPLFADFGIFPLVQLTEASNTMFAYKSPECHQYRHLSLKSNVYCLNIIILDHDKGGTNVVQWVLMAIAKKQISEVRDLAICTEDDPTICDGERERERRERVT
ncbi:Pollen receptor-like kinase 3 [Asimina triloba]